MIAVDAATQECLGLAGGTLWTRVEPNPPDGAEPVVWRLLTTHVATDAADARQIVDWYRMRWLIEQFFCTLKKQGFQIEDSQIETSDSLLKLVAIAVRAAMITMQLTQARDGLSTLPALLVFSAFKALPLDGGGLFDCSASHAQHMYIP